MLGGAVLGLELRIALCRRSFTPGGGDFCFLIASESFSEQELFVHEKAESRMLWPLSHFDRPFVSCVIGA